MALVLDGTNGVSGVDGTASNPAIEGTDSNTGIFYPAADTVAIGTGGTEALRVNSSQQLGLGVTSPAAKLDLNTGGASNTMARFTSNGSYYTYILSSNVTSVFSADTSGNNAIQIRGASNQIEFNTNGSQRMTLDASGNLLVGGTSSLYASAGRGNIEINGSSNSILALTIAGSVTNVSYFYSTSTDLEIVANGSRFMRFTTNGSERARITSDGDFLIGRTGQWSTGRLCIQKRSGNYNTVEAGQGDGGGYNFYSWAANNGGTYYHAIFTEAGTGRGSITSNGSTTSYVTTSDYRLKENVQPMTGALAKVEQLKPCTYLWKDSGADGEGFIAHELGEVCPQAVVGQKDAVDADGNPVYQGVDTSFLVATLTAAIQELNAKVEAQAAEIAALKGNA
jgi:hypothetical protein